MLWNVHKRAKRWNERCFSFRPNSDENAGIRAALTVPSAKSLRKLLGMLKVKLITSATLVAPNTEPITRALTMPSSLLSKVQTMINRLFLAVLLLCVESCKVVSLEGCKSVLPDGLPDLLHEAVEIREVVLGCKHAPEHLTGFDHMVHVCPAVLGTCAAGTSLLDGTLVELMHRLFQRHHPIIGKYGTVAGHPGRQDAVEHIDAVLNSLQDVVGASDAHHIPGLVTGDQIRSVLQIVYELLCSLPYAEASDCNTGKVHPVEELCTLFSQVLIKIALHDAEQISLECFT